MFPQGKERQGRQQTTGSQERGLGQILPHSRPKQPCRHLDFGLLDSRSARQHISAVEATQSVMFCYGSQGNLINALVCRLREI